MDTKEELYFTTEEIGSFGDSVVEIKDTHDLKEHISEF
jgi:hypothetical protein